MLHETVRALAGGLWKHHEVWVTGYILKFRKKKLIRMRSVLTNATKYVWTRPVIEGRYTVHKLCRTETEV